MGRNLLANVGDSGSVPGSGRYSGEGTGNPLQYSCLGTPMDGGARQAAVHGDAKRCTNEQTHARIVCQKGSSQSCAVSDLLT